MLRMAFILLVTQHLVEDLQVKVTSKERWKPGQGQRVKDYYRVSDLDGSGFILAEKQENGNKLVTIPALFDILVKKAGAYLPAPYLLSLQEFDWNHFEVGVS